MLIRMMLLLLAGMALAAPNDAALAEYRQAFVKELPKATKVVLYIVSFDGLREPKRFDKPSEWIAVAPYNKVTRILQTKELTKEEERLAIQAALAGAIEVKNDADGTFCHHMPIHGVRVYRGDKLMFESTFCWICQNFGFRYPTYAGWLSTNVEVEGLFKRLMPIPAEELARFEAKFPPKKEAPKNNAVPVP